MEAARGDNSDRRRALQAQRYAIRRRDGLIDWRFDTGSIERKELITWAFTKIQMFFRAVK